MIFLISLAAERASAFCSCSLAAAVASQAAASVEEMRATAHRQSYARLLAGASSSFLASSS